jgi:hypothetical protein
MSHSSKERVAMDGESETVSLGIAAEGHWGQTVSRV